MYNTFKLLYSPLYKPKEIVENPGNFEIHSEPVGFKENEARSIFRNWVTQHGAFKTMNTEKLFTPQTKYLIANVFKFKAAWKSIGSEGPVMKIYNSFNYTQDVKYEARILELPMQEELKLIILVPNEIDTLYSLFRRLCTEGLVAATNSLQPLFVTTSELQAPNIEVDSQIKLALTEDSHKYNGTAIQCGNVCVNEEGACLNVLTCLVPDNVNTSNDNSANVDARFYFAIVYNDLPIFTGQFD